MTGRHTRQPVWLTRLRAPFATTSARELPTFDRDPNPLTVEHVDKWRNRVAGGLWIAVVGGTQRIGTPGRTEAEALDHLAPRVRAVKPTSPVRSLIRRVRGIRFTRPTFTGSILPRPTEPVFRAAVTLLIGVTLGYGYSAMTIEAPQDCAKAFTLADGTFVDYENVTTAVVLMSTRGQGEYEGHEADAIQLWDDIDAARADYRAAKASCLGGAR
jgi:hypothetical protein